MKDTDAVFKALADPHRRELLDRLCERGGQTLGELCTGLPLARQSISQHLEVLASANLISTAWRGREKLHYLNSVPIHEMYERWIRKYEMQRLAALHEFKVKLERGRR
jgi:DNA-binding transcriptional ArsR family regulator